MTLVSACCYTTRALLKAPYGHNIGVAMFCLVPRWCDCGMRQCRAYLQVYLSRVRPASLNRVGSRKYVRAIFPRQWGKESRLRCSGLVEVSSSCADTSTVGMYRDQEPPPIRRCPSTKASHLRSFAGCLSGETNSFTLPARCCDMYRYELPRAYDRPAGIGAMTTGTP